MQSPMTRQRSVTVLAAAFRRRLLSFEKAFSIGLKSGEYGGRNRSVASRLDCLANVVTPVGRQVVEDDDVAPVERGYEYLPGVSQEPFASHWPVEDHRCRHAKRCQGANEGCRLPVAVWDRSAQAFTPRRASMQARHFRVGRGLVDEHQRVRIEVGLILEPCLALH
jgi:hypothetical protein